MVTISTQAQAAATRVSFPLSQADGLASKDSRTPDKSHQLPKKFV
jgi:hypothetical protein